MSTSCPANATTHAPLPPPPLPTTDTGWALLLDVDGTLLDFADDPHAVHADDELIALLDALHEATDGALALVSGRRLDDLDRLFERPRRAAIGLHGLELRAATGELRRHAVAPLQQARMQHEAQALAERFARVQLENKQQAVALHCRGSSGEWQQLHEAAIAVIAHLPGYELQAGRRVLEFKPGGMDKGRAVAELLQRDPFRGRLPVYLGDDLTDEHAFDAVNRAHGLSIRVGDRHPSAARFTLPDPAATIAWLARVLDALTQGAPTHVRPTERKTPGQP
ncbi:MAG: trehalose-phosphatase [Rhodanobacter sp.]